MRAVYFQEVSLASLLSNLSSPVWPKAQVLLLSTWAKADGGGAAMRGVQSLLRRPAESVKEGRRSGAILFARVQVLGTEGAEKTRHGSTEVHQSSRLCDGGRGQRSGSRWLSGRTSLGDGASSRAAVDVIGARASPQRGQDGQLDRESGAALECRAPEAPQWGRHSITPPDVHLSGVRNGIRAESQQGDRDEILLPVLSVAGSFPSEMGARESEEMTCQ